jgi:predicted ester cyclase
MNAVQTAKRLVAEYYRELDQAQTDQIAPVIRRYVSAGFTCRAVHPFNELSGPDAVAGTVWEPMRRSIKPLQRRQDIFMAGLSETDQQIWVCSMGHFMGLLDESWLGVPTTGKLVYLRYAEFHRVAAGRIAECGFFCDVLGLMKQVGLSPLPPSTAADILVPGPRTHDGLLFEAQDDAESARTLALVNQMKDDLVGSPSFGTPTSVLARTWQNGMLWFGPGGIGSTYTIDRYAIQHQGPFSRGLSNVTFNGHVCRFAEGHYAGWFGWPNLTMTPNGGFLGLPSSPKRVDMRVVDIYRREQDKLAENWILIDLLHWLLQQDVDILDRMHYIATAR